MSGKIHYAWRSWKRTQCGASVVWLNFCTTIEGVTCKRCLRSEAAFSRRMPHVRETQGHGAAGELYAAMLERVGCE